MKTTALFRLAIIVCVLSPCVCFAQISRSKYDVDRDAQAAAGREQRAEDAKRTKAAEEVSRQQKAHADASETKESGPTLDQVSAERERLKAEKALRAETANANVPTNVETNIEGLYFTGKVLQILDGGILASGCVMTESEKIDKDIADKLEAYGAAEAMQEEQDAAVNAEHLYDYDRREHRVDALTKIGGMVGGGFDYGGMARAERQLAVAEKQSKYNREIAKNARAEWYKDHTRTCLILGTPRGLVDDDLWHGHVFESGTYQYVNTMGTKATVRKYTAIPKKK